MRGDPVRGGIARSLSANVTLLPAHFHVPWRNNRSNAQAVWAQQGLNYAGIVFETLFHIRRAQPAEYAGYG